MARIAVPALTPLAGGRSRRAEPGSAPASRRWRHDPLRGRARALSPPGSHRHRRARNVRTSSLLAAIAVAYLAVLLWVDRGATYPQQLGLGVLTWLVLAAALVPLSPERRAQALGVVCFATIGELTGSLVWGVYSYRLHNLPLFIPPAHGLVFLAGLSLSVALARHARALVLAAAFAATAWALLGLTVLPHRDAAGAIGVPLLLLFLWRSRFRAVYAGVFVVVGALELYGTAIGTWRWAPELPGLGIPDGNPPSGVASGYVWFDVMAMLVAPVLLRVLAPLDRRRSGRAAVRTQT